MADLLPDRTRGAGMRTELLAIAVLVVLFVGSDIMSRGAGTARGEDRLFRWDPDAVAEGYDFVEEPWRSGSFGQASPTFGDPGRPTFSYPPFQSGNRHMDPVSAPTDSTEDPISAGWSARVASLTRGRLQLEGGYAYLTDRVGGIPTSQHALPDLLLRVGLTERLEARIGWPGYVSTRYHGPLGFETSETLDPNVGFMFDLWPQRGWLPQTAVAASIPITLSGNPFALEGLQPLAEVLYAWELTDRCTLGGNTGYALFRHPDDHYSQFQQSLGVDYLVTDRLTGLVQWEMLSNHGSADDGVEHMLGGGCWYALTERWSVGGRLAGGLNPRAPDFLATLRFAVRF
jgi:hypothetical protein